MKIRDILFEAIPLSQAKPLVKGWDKSRYEELFKSSPLQKDKNAYRLYMPLGVQQTKIKPLPSVVTAVDQAGYNIEDYTKGLAKSKKDGRIIKFGKILPKEIQNQFALDPQRSSTKSEYMLVISRHPYDVAGMSTGRGWTSCMNLNDGEYKKYIPAEIKNGTLVAYAIRADDLDIKNPIARLAIKPFVNRKHPEIVIFGVEPTVYGTAPAGFKKAVVNWANGINASHKLDDLVIFNMRRGSYNDGLNSAKAAGSNKNIDEYYKIKNDPEYIQHIKNPTEAIQMVAVELDGSVIRHIKNPSEAVQLAAVKMFGLGIQFIKNPSEAVQTAAVTQYRFAIKYIKNPSEAVQLAAVEQNGFAIKHIKNPSEAVKLAAVNKFGLAIEYVKNPSEAVQLAAVKQDDDAIYYIKNPSKVVQLAAQQQTMSASAER